MAYSATDKQPQLTVLQEAWIGIMESDGNTFIGMTSKQDEIADWSSELLACVRVYHLNEGDIVLLIHESPEQDAYAYMVKEYPDFFALTPNLSAG